MIEFKCKHQAGQLKAIKFCTNGDTCRRTMIHQTKWGKFCGISPIYDEKYCAFYRSSTTEEGHLVAPDECKKRKCDGTEKHKECFINRKGERVRVE